MGDSLICSLSGQMELSELTVNSDAMAHHVLQPSREAGTRDRYEALHTEAGTRDRDEALHTEAGTRDRDEALHTEAGTRDRLCPSFCSFSKALKNTPFRITQIL